MARLHRIGTALSALALVGALSGCASQSSRSGQSASIVAKSEVGLALRAQMALAGGDFAEAVKLAEQAVESRPEDAMMRALLGNVYFGAGRFASAEEAYLDTLTLVSNEPKIVLKLALVQIAQGKNGEALSFLNAARDVLNPADYGLALALAGRPQQAVAILEPAARMNNGDARIRQNLALALGLSGDWTAARTIAAQDLPANQVDARVRQWMGFAQPSAASAQVAALVGVTPAASDPGQPVRLALRDRNERLALLSSPQAAEAYQPVETVQEVAFSEPAPAAQPIAYPEAPVLAANFELPEEIGSGPGSVPVPTVAAAPSINPVVTAMPAAAPKPRKSKASPAKGSSGLVVQLGAYSSRNGVAAAWDQFSGRYGKLRQYTPATARFESPKGTLYRLSVKGFGSLSEAKSLCGSLKAQGKNCFVRRVAGDAPVQFASR